MNLHEQIQQTVAEKCRELFPDVPLRIVPQHNVLVRANLKTADALQHPGDFTWLCSSATAASPTAIQFVCPCGCGAQALLPLDCEANKDDDGFKWGWDGDLAAPTLAQPVVREDGCFFKGNLVKGIWVVR